jgi:hypothetical protein
MHWCLQVKKSDGRIKWRVLMFGYSALSLFYIFYKKIRTAVFYASARSAFFPEDTNLCF